MKRILLTITILTGLLTTKGQAQPPIDSFDWRVVHSFMKCPGLYDSTVQSRQFVELLYTAIAYDTTKQYAAAITFYKQAIILSKNAWWRRSIQPPIAKRIADLYAHQRQYREAIVYYDSLIIHYPMYTECGNGYDAWLERIAEATANCFNTLHEYDSTIKRYTYMLFDTDMMGYGGPHCYRNLGKAWYDALTALYDTGTIRAQLALALQKLGPGEFRDWPGPFKISGSGYTYYTAPFFSGQLAFVFSKEYLSQKERKQEGLVKKKIIRESILPSHGYYLANSFVPASYDNTSYSTIPVN